MISDFEVIPSVRDVRHLDYALSVAQDYVQLTGTHIGNLKQWTARCHQQEKRVLVNHELVAGLGSDKMAFQMLKQLYQVDGLISSNITKIHLVKNMKMKVMYRITLMDSISVDNALKFIKEVKFDAIELRPYYHAIEFLPKFREVWDGKYYAAGFVNTKERVLACKEAGFHGVMTSTKELWSMEI